MLKKCAFCSDNRYDFGNITIKFPYKNTSKQKDNLTKTHHKKLYLIDLHVFKYLIILILAVLHFVKNTTNG